MKKPYSLDYDIERDTDRVIAVADILDKLAVDPSPTELEQMGSYILYGKDEEGYNAVQRGEITNGNTRYSSFRRKADKNVSLDSILANPLADQQSLEPTVKKNPYQKRKPVINRPKYDRKTGELIDIGDADIPGMTELWASIDRMEHWLAVLEGKIPAAETDHNLFDDPYRLYQLKHTLIDMRRHQYYLKDSYKPTLHFPSIDHPKAQFIDWTSDSAYWMPYDKWKDRVDHALLSSISKKIEDYETRENASGELEVKWVVRRHTFNWEDPLHVRALINNYDALYDYVYDKLDTYSRTLIFDFERYRKMANFSELREFLLDRKLARTPYEQLIAELKAKFGVSYNENHLSTILAREIPQRIALAAQRYRICLETTDSEKKQCFHCKQWLPRTTLFFARNRTRKDGFASSCKECERQMRIARGGQYEHDGRTKEATLLKMQAGKA